MSLLRNKGFRFRESGLLCNINYNRARSLKWVKLRRGNFPCDFILFFGIVIHKSYFGGFASPPLKHRFLLVWDWELIYWPECLGARGVNVINQQQQINHFSVEIWRRRAFSFLGWNYLKSTLTFVLLVGVVGSSSFKPPTTSRVFLWYGRIPNPDVKKTEVTKIGEAVSFLLFDILCWWNNGEGGGGEGDGTYKQTYLVREKVSLTRLQFSVSFKDLPCF